MIIIYVLYSIFFHIQLSRVNIYKEICYVKYISYAIVHCSFRYQRMYSGSMPKWCNMCGSDRKLPVWMSWRIWRENLWHRYSLFDQNKEALCFFKVVLCTLFAAKFRLYITVIFCTKIKNKDCQNIKGLPPPFVISWRTNAL